MVCSGHILLADDEAHVLHILARRLEAEGYRLTTATNGREALEAAGLDRPDLIITDLQMPLMNGIELALALRRAPATADVPLIMLTGRGYTVDSEALARTNVRELRSKPFSAKSVVALVGAILLERSGPGASIRKVA
jgi:DNA-binding response OmpR family regulator